MEQTNLSPALPVTSLDSSALGAVSHNSHAEGSYWNGYINENAASEFTGVSTRTLQGWRYRGGGPRYFRLSAKLVRYRRIDLHDYAEKCARTSTSDEGRQNGT
jgi:hypothetical protein